MIRTHTFIICNAHFQGLVVVAPQRHRADFKRSGSTAAMARRRIHRLSRHGACAALAAHVHGRGGGSGQAPTLGTITAVPEIGSLFIRGRGPMVMLRGRVVMVVVGGGRGAALAAHGGGRPTFAGGVAAVAGPASCCCCCCCRAGKKRKGNKSVNRYQAV